MSKPGKRNVRGLDEDGLRVLYGTNPIREAFRAGRQVTELLVRKGQAKKLAKAVEAQGRAGAIREVDNHTLSQTCGSPQHQGVVARVEALANTSLRRLAETQAPDILVLMIDGVQDPGNLGALLRCADGAGVDLVVVSSRGSASIQLGSVAKASAGASEHQPILVVGDLARCLDEMKEHGFQRLALEAGEGQSLRETELRFPLCLVVGGEDHGVKGKVREACDGLAHLPLRGKVNSLNVSAAGAVAVFEAAARR